MSIAFLAYVHRNRLRRVLTSCGMNGVIYLIIMIIYRYLKGYSGFFYGVLLKLSACDDSMGTFLYICQPAYSKYRTVFKHTIWYLRFKITSTDMGRLSILSENRRLVKYSFNSCN